MYYFLADDTHVLWKNKTQTLLCEGILPFDENAVVSFSNQVMWLDFIEAVVKISEGFSKRRQKLKIRTQSWIMVLFPMFRLCAKSWSLGY